VKEICELAEINRATFYTHYNDPFDLLEQIEQELFEDLMATVSNDPHQSDRDRLTIEVFKVIENNADLCKVLFSEHGDSSFLRRVMETSRSKAFADLQREYPQMSEPQMGYLFAFMVGGTISVIEEWVRTGMREIPLPIGNVSLKVIEAWGNAKQ
jgi:AcrR family transcriptional regulator